MVSPVTRTPPAWRPAFDALVGQVGREQPLDHLTRQIYVAVRGLRAPVVGGMQIVCSDECELECQEAFQLGFAATLLPRLKFSHHSPFRSTNLGGRYEWGSLGVAVEHYAAAPEASWLMMVVKVNAHTAVEPDPAGGLPRYGRLLRYRAASDNCGALHGLLAGGGLPAHDELADVFHSEGMDRVTLLRDRQHIPAGERMLRAAIVSARLQARQVVLDIQQHHAAHHVSYLVLPCVTLNRETRDTEFLVGVYGLARTPRGRDTQAGDRYRGLGDDPRAYALDVPAPNTVRVSDADMERERAVRDHRELIGAHFEGVLSPLPDDERLHRILAEVETRPYQEDHVYAKSMVRSLARLLAELNPVTSAMLCFSQGVADLRHAHQVHRLAHGQGDDEEARRLVHEICDRLDHLPAQRATALLDALVAARQRA